VLGGGNVKSLPVEVQDRRFFFKMYATALLHYLAIGERPSATADDVHAVVLDSNDLFFDSIGSGQFEKAEYVDRRSATASQAPTDITITADILNGIFNDYTFSRYLYRGESALYRAVTCTSTDPNACAPGDVGKSAIGQEENRALLTNIVGSPLLASSYSPVAKTNRTAYQCATADPLSTTNTFDPLDLDVGGKCNKQVPPLTHGTDKCYVATDCPARAVGSWTLCDGGQPAAAGSPGIQGVCADITRDDAGRPFLAGYPGAIGPAAQTVFRLGKAEYVKVAQTFDTIQSASIQVGFHVDPYDMTSAYVSPNPAILVPWKPKQPGVGFPIALTGTRDKFVDANQLEINGDTIAANIDYDIDPTGQLTIQAVETTDFLGDVFVCKDTATGDILTARMYTAVAVVLDWFSAHPAAYNGCQMIIRYSPFNNYVDYITSLQNGVRLGVTQGGGFGRIVDATLFMPGL
jgi:hypothetical protein